MASIMSVNQTIREMHRLTNRKQAFVFVTIDGKKPLRFFTNSCAIKASSQAFTLTYDRSFDAQSISAPLGAVSKLPEGRTGVCFDHLRGKVVIEIKNDLEAFLKLYGGTLLNLKVNGQPVHNGNSKRKELEPNFFNFTVNPFVQVGGDIYHADPFGESLITFGESGQEGFAFHATPYPWSNRWDLCGAKRTVNF